MGLGKLPSRRARFLTAFLVIGISVLLYIEPVTAATFTNPIAEYGQDPWVIYHDGYYYASSGWGGLLVSKARKLQDIGVVIPVKVWTPPTGTPYSKEIWAPELHYLDGKWYIYFAADDGKNVNHRMYVLEGNSQNPQGSYTFKGQLKPSTDLWAIDGTVLALGNGERFLVWSGYVGPYVPWNPYRQNLYIAQMSNPWTINGDRHLLSRPQYDWESVYEPSQGGWWKLNEGPEVLKRNDKIHIIYSASAATSETYCLGQLTYSSGDVLDANSWVKKRTAVFSGTSEVYGPGHASFTKSPDGTEDWIVYHSKKNTGWNFDRQVSAQKFTWNANDEPVFGSPIAPGVPIQEPSGTTQTSTSAPTTAPVTTTAATSSLTVSASKSGPSTSMGSITTAEAALEQGWTVPQFALLAIGAAVVVGVVILRRGRPRRKEQRQPANIDVPG